MQYIVLLRGINVGGRTLKMDALKTCLESKGFQKVQTVLQTGNVILESDETDTEKLKTAIEGELTASFHYPAKVLIITPAFLKRLLKTYPFSNEDSSSHCYIVFTNNGFEKTLVATCGSLDEKTEAIKSGESHVCWRVLKGNTLDSTFGKFLGKSSVKNLITTRNINTLEKILAKCTG